jgi:putative transposase
MLSVVTDEAARSELTMSLDELAREGARRMLAAALEAEVDLYLAAFAELVDERGHRLVRRNGHAPARQLATGVGQVEVVRPRVDDAGWIPTAASASSSTARSCPMVPPLAQGGPGAAAAVLHGLSSSDFVPALEELFGSAAGLSAWVITRLTSQWQAEREAFAQRELSGVD